MDFVYLHSKKLRERITPGGSGWAGMQIQPGPHPAPSPGGAAQASEGTPLFLFLSAPATRPRNAMPSPQFQGPTLFVPSLSSRPSFFQCHLRWGFLKRSSRSAQPTLYPSSASWGCGKPVTTTRWRQTTEIHVFSHRAGGQRSKFQVLARPRFSAGSRGRSLPRLLPVSWWRPAILGTPWLAEASHQPMPPPSHGTILSVCAHISLPRTPVIGSGLTLAQYDLILTGRHQQRPHLQIRSHS